MESIIIPVFSITAIGVICAALLSIASKYMHVEVDERILEVQTALPGSNCGACGFPGCAGYAKALNEDVNVKTNLCTPGGARVAARLGEILGVQAEGAAVKVAVVRCCGDCKALQKKMNYIGIRTCAAAIRLYGGEGACTYGCLGYGDCKAVCPTGAIIIEDELARINTELCTGCGLCVKVCPNNIITVIEYEINAPVVLCKNLEKGAVVRKKCSSGCLGCGKCKRECPMEAITVEDYLAGIDNEKCTLCGHCSEVCVTHCIKPLA